MELVLCVVSIILTMCHLNAEARSAESLQSDDASCFNFSVGDSHKREFYSPNYPNDYPNNIKCTLRITADAGHMVMLDFRDVFDLENTARCEYDRLEVRDGAYGYSPLIGAFCGGQFPKKMYSSRRHMWLQFSSDDSIPHRGFRAVYEYVPIPNQGSNIQDTEKECAYHRSGPSGLIQKSEIEPFWQRYRQEEAVECMWTIEAEAGKQLYLNFNKYKLERPNDCDQNFIQVFGSGRTPDHMLAKFCGTTAEPQKSLSNLTHVRLFAHRDVVNKTDFVIHYTAFREIKKEEQCDAATEFNCGDQTCVDISLKCDGEYDCKYRYDEEPSLCARALGASLMLTSEHMIVILVVFFGLVLAMCASISASCYNKIQKRRLREREYKERRSKEASVEATLERPRDDDGCYVPEARKQAGAVSDQMKPQSAFQQQRYPFISESFESLNSDVVVPPAPPPVPLHKKERSEEPAFLAGGRKLASSTPTHQEQVPMSNLWNLGKSETAGWSVSNDKSPRAVVPDKDDPKASWLRGGIDSGPSRLPRVPVELGLPKYGAPREKQMHLSAYRDDSSRTPSYRLGINRNLTSRAESDLRTDPSDSSRAHSVASTLSAPDAVAGRPR